MHREREAPVRWSFGVAMDEEVLVVRQPGRLADKGVRIGDQYRVERWRLDRRGQRSREQIVERRLPSLLARPETRCVISEYRKATPRRHVPDRSHMEPLVARFEDGCAGVVPDGEQKVDRDDRE